MLDSVASFLILAILNPAIAALIAVPITGAFNNTFANFPTPPTALTNPLSAPLPRLPATSATFPNALPPILLAAPNALPPTFFTTSNALPKNPVLLAAPNALPPILLAAPNALPPILLAAPYALPPTFFTTSTALPPILLAAPNALPPTLFPNSTALEATELIEPIADFASPIIVAPIGPNSPFIHGINLSVSIEMRLPNQDFSFFVSPPLLSFFDSKPTSASDADSASRNADSSGSIASCNSSSIETILSYVLFNTS